MKKHIKIIRQNFFPKHFKQILSLCVFAALIGIVLSHAEQLHHRLVQWCVQCVAGSNCYFHFGISRLISTQPPTATNVPPQSCPSEPCCSSQTSASTDLTLYPFSSSYLTSKGGNSLKSTSENLLHLQSKTKRVLLELETWIARTDRKQN